MEVSDSVHACMIVQADVCTPTARNNKNMGKFSLYTHVFACLMPLSSILVTQNLFRCCQFLWSGAASIARVAAEAAHVLWAGPIATQRQGVRGGSRAGCRVPSAKGDW